MKYKFLEHTADVKFQAFGKTIEEAFKNSALAAKEAICGKTRIREKISRKINVKGKDLESLMYKFLEEILYLLDAENFMISRIKKVKLDREQFKIEAEIAGDKAENYNFTNQVKAATYNDMFVKRERGKWIAQVVLDV